MLLEIHVGRQQSQSVYIIDTVGKVTFPTKIQKHIKCQVEYRKVEIKIGASPFESPDPQIYRDHIPSNL